MSIYDGQFRGNILVAGKADCGKIEWVSGIEISKERQAEIQTCFSNKVEFYPAFDAEKIKKNN